MTKMVNMAGLRRCATPENFCRFFLRDAFVYVVDEDFRDFPTTLPLRPAWFLLKYTVDLANLPALGMEEATVIIGAANPGYTT